MSILINPKSPQKTPIHSDLRKTSPSVYRVPRRFILSFSTMFRENTPFSGNV